MPIIAAGYRPYSIDKSDIKAYKTMMYAHQFHKVAQLRLLKIVEFSVGTTSLFPLVARVLMQCEGVVMEFEARSMKIRRCSTLSAL